MRRTYVEPVAELAGVVGATPSAVLASQNLDDFAGSWPTSERGTEAAAFVFQYAEILRARQVTIAAAQRADVWYVAVLADDERPLMLLPLAIQTRSGVRLLSFLDGGLSDYNAPVLFAPTRAWTHVTMKAVWRALRRVLPRFDLAVLQKIPPEVCGTPNPLMSLVTDPHSASGHATLLGARFETYVARLPRRQDSRRKRRRLQELGTLRFKVHGLADHQSALEAVVRQKTRRQRETGSDLLFDQPGMKAFVETLTGRNLDRGLVHLATLTLDETIIATHWGLVAGRRFYYLLPGYEAGKWRRYSAGRLLLEHLIEWCFANRITMFDFGIGDDAYKAEFCEVEIPLYCATLPITALGASLAAVIRSKAWAKRQPRLVAGVRAFKRLAQRNDSTANLHRDE